MPQGKFASTIVLLLLVGAPLLGEQLSNWHVRREQTSVIKQTRVTDLPNALTGVVKQTRGADPPDALKCISTTRCTADLNEDGIVGIIEVVPLAGSFYPDNRGLLVIEGNKELLWLPFHHSDIPFRYSDAEASTRIAVMQDSYGTRLLVSDVSCPDLHEAVFEWNGVQLVKLRPTEAERGALSFMSSMSDFEDYANADRYVNRVEVGPIGHFSSVVKLGLYYMVLLILGAVLLYRKSVQLSAASPSPFSRGNP